MENEIISVIRQYAESEGLLPSQVEVLGELGNGLINSSVLLKVRGGKQVLRLRKPLPERIPRDWNTELYAMRLASDADLSPNVRFVSENPTAMILEYGGVAETNRLSSKQLSRLAEALAKMHSLKFEPNRLPRQEYRCLVESYLELASARHNFNDRLRACTQEMIELADWCNQATGSYITHHDLTEGNILWQNERVRFIDWEYVCAGNPEFDLATVVKAYGLNIEESAVLRSNYNSSGGFARMNSAEQTRMKRFIELLELLWTAAISAGE